MDLLTPAFGLIFWQTVTLCIVLLILSKFAWRPILQVIQTREEEVSAALKAAAVANAMLKKAEVDRAHLVQVAHKERERIIEDAIAAKQVILEESKLEAEREHQKAIEQANALIQKEKEMAITLLKNKVAGMAIHIAEKLLKHELQHYEAQEKLIQQFIKESAWHA